MELEEINIADIEEKVTLRNQYNEALGKAISQDYFVFTCFEEEKTQRFLKAGNPQRFQWEESAEEGEELDLSILARFFAHYKEVFPELAGTGPLDYKKHGEILSFFVTMVLDLEYLLEKKFGLSLPILQRNMKPASKYEQIWQAVAENVEATFSPFSRYMLAYLRWSYEAAPPINIELKNLPPVGRYLPLLYASQKAAMRQAFAQERAKNKGPEGTRSRGNGNDDDEASPRSTKAQEKEALDEVDEVLAKIKDQDEPINILLKPQNSYLRRVQHKKVKEAGFDSKSEGEGKLRALRILGPRPTADE